MLVICIAPRPIMLDPVLPLYTLQPPQPIASLPQRSWTTASLTSPPPPCYWCSVPAGHRGGRGGGVEGEGTGGGAGVAFLLS